MRRHPLLILLAALALPGAAEAQERTARPDALFLERSRIFNRLPMDDLAFEGQIAPHLFFHRGDPWGGGDVFMRPVNSWAVSFTPLVRLRMLSTTSFPVRTPSYMPRPLGDWQIFHASVADTTWAGRRRGEVPVRIWGLTLTPWAHHSNGQNGCLFEDQTRDPATDECVGSGTRAGLPTVNRINGSFSTNFLRAAVGYAWFAPPREVGDRLEGNDRCTYELGVEYHPLGYMPGPLSEEQAEFYPQLQATVGLEWGRGFHGQWLVGGEARWLKDPAPAVGDWAFSAQVDYMPSFLDGWGAFARYYSGMDYYNLGFMEEIDYVQFGFVWDLGAVPEFLLPGTVNIMQEPPPYERSRLLDETLPGLFDGLCGALH